MSDQKTEAPTPRRITQARERGESVGRSHELVMATTLGAGVLALSSFLPGIVTALAGTMHTAVIEAGQRDPTGVLITSRLGQGIIQGLSIGLPIALVVMVGGIVASLASGGWIMSFGSVSFRAARMNPINGLRNLVNRQALVRLGMATVKLLILAGVTWSVLSPRIPRLLAVSDTGIGQIAGTALGAIFDLGLALSFLMIAVGLTDFVLQRRRARNALKMTKEEVRQEGKDQEGNPQIRMALRRRARQLAMSRMMAAVPTADVVVVNPIRLAIALRYDQQTMRAPTIVAKGQRLMAARIRDLAKANGVPIIEDVPLARALFTRPLGSEVPAHLYRAIARILVLVHQTRFGRRPAPAAAQATRGTTALTDPSANPLINRRTDPPDYPIQGADR